jgi:hypothetical protein
MAAADAAKRCFASSLNCSGAPEPLGDREFAQMTGTGKQIRMRDVALREILREGFEMGVMAEDVRCESYGMTIVADKLSRKGYLTLA